MRLYDFLEVFDENKKIDVWDASDNDRQNLLTFYDGLNSIDLDFNYCDVVRISSHFDEYDEVAVVDVYIKQDDKSKCLNDIAEYLRNEFDENEGVINGNLNDEFIGLAHTTSWLDEHEDEPLQASYDFENEILIFEAFGGYEIKKPVSYKDLVNYLDFDYLVGECNSLFAEN